MVLLSHTGSKLCLESCFTNTPEIKRFADIVMANTPLLPSLHPIHTYTKKKLIVNLSLYILKMNFTCKLKSVGFVLARI